MSYGKGSRGSPSARNATAGAVFGGPALKYLVVGGISFALDFVLLVFLHEVLGVDLWIATPVAFLASFAVNYLLSRFFTFAGTGAKGASFFKYAALVAFNAVAASLVVSGFEVLGGSYMLGKIISTAAMTVWNFFIYKYWVFAGKDTVLASGTTS